MRVVAGVLLAAVTLWFAPQPASALKAASHGCSMSTEAAGGPALVAAMAEEPCHHPAYGCPLTAACAGATAAVQPGAVELVLGNQEAALELPRVRALPDLVRRGPPTPPPNS